MATEEVSIDRLIALNERNALALGRPRAVTDALAKLALRERRRRFVEARGPDGKPWARNAPVTTLLKGAGKRPLSRTGRLRGDLSYRMESDTVAVIGVRAIYGPVHQHGGVIRPVRAKYLAIPVRPQAARAGSPRNVAGLVCIKTGTGLILAKVTRRAVHIWYLLRKEVKIEARPFLGSSPKEEAAFGRAVVTFLKEQL